MNRAHHRVIGVAALAAGFVIVAGVPSADAQVPGCDRAKTFLDERKTLVAAINGIDKKSGKMDARQACGAFGKLAKNGEDTVKWMEANKAWCQIPGPFIDNIKQDNERATEIRGKACDVATKQAAMEKKMREQQKQGAQGSMQQQLGGGGLTGELKIPKGAL